MSYLLRAMVYPWFQRIYNKFKYITAPFFPSFLHSPNLNYMLYFDDYTCDTTAYECVRTTLKHQNIINRSERVWISFKIGEKKKEEGWCAVCTAQRQTKSMVWPCGGWAIFQRDREMRENNLLFYWSARNEPIIFNLISVVVKRKWKKGTCEWCGVASYGDDI